VCPIHHQAFHARLREDAHRLAGGPAAPEDEVGLTREQRGEDDGVFVDSVLEVTILDQHDVARGVLEALTHGGALAPGRVLQDQLDARPPCVPPHDVPAPVGGVALHNDQLDIDVRELERCDLVQDGGNGGGLVVDREDDADPGQWEPHGE
jgi:hypothetical protein